jgi:hypothetical protein
MSEASSSQPRPRRLRRVLVRTGLGAVTLFAAWLALTIHPQPLFAHSLRRANVVLHARAPLPPEAGPILDEVVRGFARSPLYDPGRTHDVFLCDTPALFAFFVPYARKVGGVANLTGNVFIRPANVARNRVVGPSGDEKGGERTLAYFAAHEVTHLMTMDHTGRLAYRRLSAFQTEGYADYVAFARPVDLGAGREAMRRDQPEMDARRSGLYRRYELLVAYLLDRKGITVPQLLAARMNVHDVEHQLDADTTL